MPSQSGIARDERSPKDRRSMTIRIGGYTFRGPHRNSRPLLHSSGVYVILGGDGTAEWTVLDVGESADVRKRVDNHERTQNWRACNHLMTAFAILYVPAPDRMYIEQELRAQYNPPCRSR